MSNELLWGQAEDKWEGLDYSPIPAGEYSVVIDTAKFDYTKGDPMSGKQPKGHYLFSFTVLDGAFKGRKVRHKLWTESTNADYVKGCYSFLKQLYTLLQVPSPSAPPADADLFPLVNKPMNVSVRVEKSEYNGEKREENSITKVSSYRVIPANGAGAAGVTPQAPQEDGLPF
jgi:hypothetical protein